MKNLKFKVLEIQPKENGKGFYAKLCCEFVAHRGKLGVLEQEDTKRITYYYPMKTLADGVKVGKQEDMFVTIPHTEYADQLIPVGFTVRTSSFVPEDETNEIHCKWLYHESPEDANRTSE